MQSSYSSDLLTKAIFGTCTGRCQGSIYPFEEKVGCGGVGEATRARRSLSGAARVSGVSDCLPSMSRYYARNANKTGTVFDHRPTRSAGGQARKPAPALAAACCWQGIKLRQGRGPGARRPQFQRWPLRSASCRPSAAQLLACCNATIPQLGLCHEGVRGRS